MKILDSMSHEGFEQIIALSDPSCGLAGYMLIHDTSRGPAAGGIRLFPYQSEDFALADGFRLARAMTLKAAAADLPVGGGKIVIIDHADLVREDVLRSVGRAIQGMGGRFLAGRDVGVSVAQGAWVRDETGFMVDESEEGVGDLNIATATGVEAGARAALRLRLETDSWSGVRAAIQGAGSVGGCLATLLAKEGADLVVADPEEKRLEALAELVSFDVTGPEDIYSASKDVFCPCAVGGIMNIKTIERLGARVVAGSANNVLADARMGRLLHLRGVTYVPDYLVNAGALIQGIRYLRDGERDSREAIRGIGERVERLLDQAHHEDVPPEALLERQTLERLHPQRSWKDWYWPAV